MDPADLRVIRRLSERVNVLPIIARADILTDEKLNAVKLAIRRDLYSSKLGFSVFGPVKYEEESERPVSSADESAESSGNKMPASNESGNSSQVDEGFGDEESEEEERRSRPVIKLNPKRRALTRSTSRSRLEHDAEDKRVPMPLESADPESLASARFSAAYLASRTPRLADSMPFAVIMPEQTGRVRRALKAPPLLRPVSAYSVDSAQTPMTPVTQNGDVANEGEHHDHDRGAATPTAANSNGNGSLKMTPSTDYLPYMSGPPRDLKGVFVRRFRWGVIDVLDPEHCDFAALRTAILSTHFKARFYFILSQYFILTWK